MRKPPKKLPRGVKLRDGRYVLRERRRGIDRLIDLGADENLALAEYHRRRAQDGVVRQRLTVPEAVELWLTSYVQTNRNPKGVQLARFRAQTYLAEFFRFAHVDRVEPDRLRQYRVWVEGSRTPKLAPKTVSDIVGDAVTFWRWCEECRLVDRAPIPRKLRPCLLYTF
jgi:hypothetical protein